MPPAAPSHTQSIAAPAPTPQQNPTVVPRKKPATSSPKSKAPKPALSQTPATKPTVTPPVRKTRRQENSENPKAKRVADKTPAKVRSSGKKVPTAAGEQLAQQEEGRRKTPSWLASLIFHLVLLLVLALIPMQNLVTGPLTLVFGESGPQGTSEFELKGVETSKETMPTLEDTATFDTVVDPTEFLEDIKLPELDTGTTPAASAREALKSLPFGIKNGLTGRSGALKDALLAKYGGTQETEAAVELGLKWLAKQQKSNGSWSLEGPYSDGAATENLTAATAMALNAFLGAGYTHKEGKYKENVKLGLAYLRRMQDSEGFFSRRPKSRHTMYAQAIASITVIEAYGLSGDEDMRAAAMKAIAFAEWAQSSSKGWRYEPRSDSDLSVTGWYLMALVTAKMSGLPIDEEKFNSVSEYLDRVAYEDDTKYSYKRIEGPSLSMTAEGLLCRIYLGWPKSDPALMQSIVENLLPAKPRLNERDYHVYYWYYATQVLHHVGGKFWDEWNEAMRTVLPAMQEKTGTEAGSWDPTNDMFGASGGRLYTTCLNLYCLEVYYRHLSIYDLK